jgi:hypothetical protein
MTLTDPHINPLGAQRAFERIRAEFLEMPGMRLTPEQVQRLCGIELRMCRVVLDDLVDTKFLRLEADGTYLHSVGNGPSRSGS